MLQERKPRKKLSQDQMIKNLIRDYPVDSLEFFKPEVIERYGKPMKHRILIQEMKKFFHSDPNLKNDILIMFEFANNLRLVLTLVENWSDKAKFETHRFAQYVIDVSHQFSDADILPIALFTDSQEQWKKQPK